MHLPSLEAVDDALFDRLVSVNLKGACNVMRLAAKRVSAGGRIVNLSISACGLALPGYSVDAATKSAVETMGEILSKKLRGRDTTVNAVAPAPVATDLFFEGKTSEQIERLEKMPAPFRFSWGPMVDG